MTERLPGWPWTSALPRRIGWYREALALRSHSQATPLKLEPILSKGDDPHEAEKRDRDR